MSDLYQDLREKCVKMAIENAEMQNKSGAHIVLDADLICRYILGDIWVDDGVLKEQYCGAERPVNMTY